MGQMRRRVPFSDLTGRVGLMVGLDFVVLRQLVGKHEILRVLFDVARPILGPLIAEDRHLTGCVAYIERYLAAPDTFCEATLGIQSALGETQIRRHAIEFIRWVTVLIQPMVSNPRTTPPYSRHTYPDGVEASFYGCVYSNLMDLWECALPRVGSRKAPTEKAWNIFKKRVYWWVGASLYAFLGNDDLEMLLVWADMMAESGDDRPAAHLGRGDPRLALLSLTLRTSGGSITDRLTTLQNAPAFKPNPYDPAVRFVSAFSPHKVRFARVLEYFEACLPIIIDGYFSLVGKSAPDSEVELTMTHSGIPKRVTMNRADMLAFYQEYIRLLRMNPAIPGHRNQALEAYIDTLQREYGDPIITPQILGAPRMLADWISSVGIFASRDCDIALEIDYRTIDNLLYGSGDFIRMHLLVAEYQAAGRAISQRQAFRELHSYIYACEWRTLQMMWATGRRIIPGASP